MFSDSNIELKESLFDERYEIIAPVGRGRNSVVYLAQRIGDSSAAAKHYSPVALKVLVGEVKRPELNSKRLRREALATLSCVHPHIVKIVDYVAQSDLCYLAMEYVECGDLRAILESKPKALSPERVLRLMIELLSGLEAIHRADIVHRDIKPENLLITGDQRLKIADFGIAFLPSEEVPEEEANRGIGTFDYLAPESLDDGLSNAGTDVYSVAITAYELMTGNLPFTGETFTEQIQHKMSGSITPLERYLGDTPGFLNEFFEVALNPARERRYGTAREFSDAISLFLEGAWRPDPKLSIQTEESKQEISEPSEETRVNSPEKIEPMPIGSAFRAQAAALQPRLVEESASEVDSELEVEHEQSEIGTEADFAEELENENIDSERGFDFEDFQTETEDNRSADWSFSEELNELEDPAPKPSNNGLGRILKWAVSPPRLILILLPLFLFWITKNPALVNSGSGIIVKIKEAVQGGEALGPESQEADDTSAVLRNSFARLSKGQRTGFIFNMLSDTESVSLVAAPGGAQGEVLIAVGVNGWQPVVVPVETLRSSSEIQLSSGGLRLTLTVDEGLELKGTTLHGTFAEQTTGRKGTWAVW